MYYVCLVKYGIDEKSTTYHYSGTIDINGNQLIVRSFIATDFCQMLFDANQETLQSMRNITPKQFIDMLNKLFSNQLYTIFSESELQGKNVKPVDNYNVTNMIARSIVDLNDVTFTVL